MIRRPPRSTHCISSAASDVYKRQVMVGPAEMDSSLDLLRTERARRGQSLALRAIPIWSDGDLRQPFAEPNNSRLSTPRDVADFLEAHWKTFRSEIDNIPEHLWTDPYPFLNPVKNGWGVYIVYHNRTFDEERCRHVPRTCNLAKRLLPCLLYTSPSPRDS